MQLSTLALLCLIGAAVVSAQVKLPQASEDELRQILSTREGALEFVNCVKLPKACRDTRAHAIARLAPMLLRTQGRCKNIKGVSCDANDERNIRFVITTLSTKYNDLYNDLIRSLLRNS